MSDGGGGGGSDGGSGGGSDSGGGGWGGAGGGGSGSGSAWGGDGGAGAPGTGHPYDYSPPPAAGTGGSTGYGAPPGYYPPPGYYAPPRKTNGLAIASLVLGIIGIAACQLAGPVGVIMGHIARRRIRESGEDGDGMALAGIITGWIGTAILVAIVVLYAVIIGFAVADPESFN